MNKSGSHSTIAASRNTPCQSREPVKRNLSEGFSAVEILWKTSFLALVDSFFERKRKSNPTLEGMPESC